MIRLEDYLLPENLQEKKKSLEDSITNLINSPHFKGSELEKSLIRNEEEVRNNLNNYIDAIVDDGGISGQSLSLDEIMELESKNYPNAESDGKNKSQPYLELYRGFKIVKNGERYEIVDSDARNYIYHTEITGLRDIVDNILKKEPPTKDEIEDERRLSESGYKDWIGDEEHYVDHENDGFYGIKQSTIFELDKEVYELNREITFQAGKSTAESIDKMIMGGESKLPDYLINDPEIVGYPDEETQREIYDWVRQKIFDLEYHKFNQVLEFSVKDIGCGRGDFYSIFKNSNYQIDYIGIDSNPNLIQVGLQKYPGTKLYVADFNEVSIPTEYTICIGTLNDDHGFDKWEFFNKTLNHALNNTKTAIIFVLQADCYGNEGHLDYPIHELIEKLPPVTKFEIDNSKFEDIYCLTVHIGQF